MLLYILEIWLSLIAIGLTIGLVVIAWRVFLLAALIGLVLVFHSLRMDMQQTRWLASQQAYANQRAIEQATPNLVPLN